ncbi:MAG: hypothetical protein CMJ33_00020 [Phycisphaerae bacterium]|nr:hypothetical protein [Phycisphaerae bacterium]
MKFLIAIELCLAMVMLFFGGRVFRVAQGTLCIIAFVALAEASAAFKRGEMTSIVVSTIVALASIVFLFMISGVRQRDKQSEPSAAVARTSGLSIFACLILCCVGIAIPLNTSLAPRTISDGAVVAREAPGQNDGSRIIEMNPMQWVGRSLLETPIGQFTPDALGQLGDKGILILYNPRCGTCHDMFDVHFSEGADIPLVALEVPPTEEAVVLESEYDEEVDCSTCIFMSLPQGPLWLVAVPYVMTVENGVVTCVAKDGPGDCL